MRTLAIVPAYNEGKSIYSVAERIRAYNSNIDIAVINDGSSDNTYTEAKRAKVVVINLLSNLGIGGAVQTGYLYALRNGYDIAIQVDGDDQHDPSDIAKLLEVIERDEADIVIGSRYVKKTGYKGSMTRRLGNKYFSLLIFFLTKQLCYDTTSGFRAVNRKVIQMFSEYYPRDYPEVETIVYAANKGMRISEVPVCMKNRRHGKSSITFNKAAYYMVKVTAALILQLNRG